MGNDWSTQYTVFDAFTGVVSALCLLVGSLQASYCLLVTWLVVTLLASAKHLGVVITHDWTDQVRLMSDLRVCQCCHNPGGLAECGGAGVHQPGGQPGLGTLQAGQVAPHKWTWSLWLLWTGVPEHLVYFFDILSIIRMKSQKWLAWATRRVT